MRRRTNDYEYLIRENITHIEGIIEQNQTTSYSDVPRVFWLNQHNAEEIRYYNKLLITRGCYENCSILPFQSDAHAFHSVKLHQRVHSITLKRHLSNDTCVHIPYKGGQATLTLWFNAIRELFMTAKALQKAKGFRYRFGDLNQIDQHLYNIQNQYKQTSLHVTSLSIFVSGNNTISHSSTIK